MQPRFLVKTSFTAAPQLSFLLPQHLGSPTRAYAAPRPLHAEALLFPLVVVAQKAPAQVQGAPARQGKDRLPPSYYLFAYVSFAVIRLYSACEGDWRRMASALAFATLNGPIPFQEWHEAYKAYAASLGNPGFWRCCLIFLKGYLGAQRTPHLLEGLTPEERRTLFTKALWAPTRRLSMYDALRAPTYRQPSADPDDLPMHDTAVLDEVFELPVETPELAFYL